MFLRLNAGGKRAAKIVAGEEISDVRFHQTSGSGVERNEETIRPLPITVIGIAMFMTPENNPFANTCVLVIDDEPAIIKIVEVVLRDMGINSIFKAQNGIEALDYFAGGVNVVDVVICDWLMPKMDGLEFLRRLRAMPLEIPFLMLTSRQEMDDIIEARDAGVSGYITKPFTTGQLREKVEKLVTMLLKEKETK